MITFRCDKLVRDNTLKRFKAAGVTPQYKIISNKELFDGFNRKLIEEAHEVHDAHNRQEMIEELADVLEVIDGLCKAQGILPEEIAAAKQVKRTERGSFERGIYIHTIQMEDDNQKAQYFKASPEKYPEV